MFWLYLSVIVIVLLGLGTLFFVMLRRLSKPIIIERVVEKERVMEKSSSASIERAVREGMKSAIRELENEKQIQKEIEATLKRKNEDMGVYASTDESEAPVKRSGGNLVPFGLSDEEKRVLEMFYND